MRTFAILLLLQSGLCLADGGGDGDKPPPNIAPECRALLDRNDRCVDAIATALQQRCGDEDEDEDEDEDPTRREWYDCMIYQKQEATDLCRMRYVEFESCQEQARQKRLAARRRVS